ncbi:hypothetical protein AAY473_031121 [Plecturocebus cupreus]
MVESHRSSGGQVLTRVSTLLPGRQVLWEVEAGRSQGQEFETSLANKSSWDIGNCHHAWLIFVFVVEMGFHRVGQAGLKLLSSSDPPTLGSQSAVIIALWEDEVGRARGEEMKTILVNMTGRFPAEKPRGSPARLFWPARLFCRRPAQRFPVQSVRDGRGTGSAGPIPTRKTAIGSAED